MGINSILHKRVARSPRDYILWYILHFDCAWCVMFDTTVWAYTSVYPANGNIRQNASDPWKFKAVSNRPYPRLNDSAERHGVKE